MIVIKLINLYKIDINNCKKVLQHSIFLKLKINKFYSKKIYLMKKRISKIYLNNFNKI